MASPDSVVRSRPASPGHAGPQPRRRRQHETGVADWRRERGLSTGLLSYMRGLRGMPLRPSLTLTSRRPRCRAAHAVRLLESCRTL
eukprot:scaffold9342_cov126-Isochrysis_galbana.AAC.10